MQCVCYIHSDVLNHTIPEVSYQLYYLHCCCCLYHELSIIQNILLYWHKLLHAAAVHRECKLYFTRNALDSFSITVHHVIMQWAITCRHWYSVRTHPLIFTLTRWTPQWVGPGQTVNSLSGHKSPFSILWLYRWISVSMHQQLHTLRRTATVDGVFAYSVMEIPQ